MKFNRFMKLQNGHGGKFTCFGLHLSPPIEVLLPLAKEWDRLLIYSPSPTADLSLSSILLEVSLTPRTARGVSVGNSGRGQAKHSVVELNLNSETLDVFLQGR